MQPTSSGLIPPYEPRAYTELAIGAGRTTPNTVKFFEQAGELPHSMLGGDIGQAPELIKFKNDHYPLAPVALPRLAQLSPIRSLSP